MKRILLPFLILYLGLFFANNKSFGSVNDVHAVAPTNPATSIIISNLTNTAVRINWTSGNGVRRIVVVRQGAAVSYLPPDNTILSGISNIFTTAADQGGGNKVVYNGTSNAVNVTGLISGQAYYAIVFEYNGSNAGTSPDAAYLISGAPSESFTTLIPAISVSPNSLTGFSTILGTSSAEQSYIVSGSQVFNNIIISAPASYEISTTSGGPWSTSLSLIPVGNSITNTPIYVRMTPTGNPGTKAGTINHTSSGATPRGVSLNGNALAVVPTVSASSIGFTKGNTYATISWTSGNGSRRLVVVKQGSPVDWAPVDYTTISGVSANFTSASEQGGGNKVVYSGTGSSVFMTGLISGQTYYVKIFEFNGLNTGSTPSAAYLITGAPVNSVTTLVPSIAVSPSSLTGFSANLGSTSPEQSYIVSATEVFANLDIAAPESYEISLTTGGPWSSTLTLAPVSYTIPNTSVYVRMNPLGSAGTKSGNVTNRSTGAANKNVFVSGAALGSAPTVPSSNISFSNVTKTSTTIDWTPGNGTGRIVVLRQGVAVNWTPTDFTTLTGVHSYFTSAADQGNGNRIVYNGAGNSVNVTGLTSGHTYHVKIYEYNGYNTTTVASVSYLITGAPAGSITMLTPSISVAPTSLSGFSAIEGGSSPEQSYTVSADQVYADVVITAPDNFQVAIDPAGPWSSALNLVPTGNTVPNTSVFVRLSPNGSYGAINGSIFNGSAGASGKTVALAGTALAAPPATAASHIVFTSVTNSTANIQWTNGSGTGRIVVLRSSSAVDWIPTNYTTLTGANFSYAIAEDKGNGNKVVYNEAGNSAFIAGLTPGETYYVAIYEYNGTHSEVTPTAAYLTTGAPVASFSATNPTIVINPVSLPQFTAALGSSSVAQSYTVTGTGLFEDLAISSSAEYEIALSSGGPWFSNLNISPDASGNINSVPVFVKLTPVAIGSSSGNIGHSSAGAVSQNLPVSGFTLLPATYVWTGATNLNWQESSNWSPVRQYPLETDTLKFTSSPAGVITNVPSENIQKLLISNSSSVTLQSSIPGNDLKLILGAASGSALDISSGSVLNISGPNTLDIVLASGSTANIQGDINLEGSNHGLAGGSWDFGPAAGVSYNGGADQSIANLNYTNLTLAGSSNLSLPSGTLILKGNFINNSAYVNHNNGTVQFEGNDVVIGGSSITDFNNIIIANNASVSLESSQNLSGTLTLGAGGIFTTVGQTFTLVSNSNSTGRIGVIPSGASVIGDIKVQRYIPASNGRYWYHLSAPVSGASFLQLKTSATNTPPNPDNGIFITGTGIANVTPDIPSIGITNTKVASVYSFNTPANTWDKPTDLANTIPAKVGYRFQIRDGRIDISPNTGAKILSLTGSPNVGNQSFPLQYSAASGGWNFIGNPYPSDISADLSSGGWNTSSANLINNTVYIYNSDADAYVTCVNGTPSTAGACIIPSFQGFWVATNVGGGNLVATENVKVAGSSTIFRKAGTFSMPIVLRNLATNITHGTLIRFDQDATGKFDNNLDALHKTDQAPDEDGPFLSICSKTDNIIYSINTLSGETEDTISLNLVTPEGDNLLDFSNLNLPENISAFLLDNQRDLLIDLKNQPLYKFSTEQNGKNGGGDRFKVVFRNSNSSNTGLVSASSSQSDIIIYPNPSRGESINVLLSNLRFNDAQLIIYDSFGRVVFRQKTTSTINSIDLNKINASGIYTLICITDTETFAEKIIVE